jgi:hypothetical protein
MTPCAVNTAFPTLRTLFWNIVLYAGEKRCAYGRARDFAGEPGVADERAARRELSAVARGLGAAAGLRRVGRGPRPRGAAARARRRAAGERHARRGRVRVRAAGAEPAAAGGVQPAGESGRAARRDHPHGDAAARVLAGRRAERGGGAAAGVHAPVRVLARRGLPRALRRGGGVRAAARAARAVAGGALAGGGLGAFWSPCGAPGGAA